VGLIYIWYIHFVWTIPTDAIRLAARWSAWLAWARRSQHIPHLWLMGFWLVAGSWTNCDVYMTYIYITIVIIYDFIRIYNYIYILPNPIVVVLMFFISFYTSSDILVDHRFHGNFCRTWYCGLGRCSAVDAVNWGKIRRFLMLESPFRMPPFFFVLPSSLGKRSGFSNVHFLYINW